jgi:hypothetical protein
MSEVKPCPFCGVDPDGLPSVSGTMFYRCSYSGCFMANNNASATLDMWNNRVEVKESSRRFAAACAAMQGIYAAWPIQSMDDFKQTDETPEAMRMIADIAVKQADALLERLEK